MVSSRKKFLVWWFRSGIAIRLALFFAVSALLFALVYWQRPDGEGTYLPTNIAVFSLVNLNIAILFVLIFLVGRNFYQLIFDRKRKILGSHLRFRLVSAIVGLTAIPAVLLIAVSSGLLNRAIDGWFSSPAEASVEAAKDIARFHFQSLEQRTAQIARSLSEEVQSKQLVISRVEDLKGLLESRRVAETLYAIEIFRNKEVSLVKVENATASITFFSPPPPREESFERAFSGEAHVVVQETPSSQFIRAFQPLILGKEEVVLVVTHRVRSEMTLALSSIRQSYQEYRQLTHFKNPLRSTYILTLYMIAGLVLFAAMWLGIQIAKQLTVPIQRLSEGMREVAKGNFRMQVHHRGDDEIAFLTRNFNQMTNQLRESTEQAESRRVYLETVLENLAVGVIVIDPMARISAVNSAVLRMLSKQRDSISYEGALVETFLPIQIWREVKELLHVEESGDDRKRGSTSARLQEREVVFSLDGREKRMLCTAGILRTRDQNLLGSVLLLDDVTALSEAQRLAAWREAARRIAHEIKNPLTPIKLAAQRLKKMFSVDEEGGRGVHDATTTIIEHVDSIQRLTDEFSRFARMPMLHLETTDMKTLVQEAVLSYIEEGSRISFQSIIDDDVPPLEVDAEQIRRLLMNLIENAVKALEEDVEQQQNESPRIVVRLSVEKTDGEVLLEVRDNGPGIPDHEKMQVFQPYFTKRSGGTGLGLAIVSSIVAEHHGDIRVVDLNPRGTRVIVSFPIFGRESTQRKLELSWKED
ncbi:ATP-binding protein [bacterium]|nr:ATP-binding protein [bacterium]